MGKSGACDPSEELSECVNRIVAEAEKLKPELEKKHLHELANSLARIERWARTGGYCIFNMADMA